MSESSEEVMTGLRRDSFERLGDDLTQLVLSYLTFADKVRLQCVSKQWSSVIYNKQFVLRFAIKGQKYCCDSLPLILNRLSLFTSRQEWYTLVDTNGLSKHSNVNLSALESVLNKCPNLKRVVIELPTDGQELELIGQRCQRLNALHYSDNVINYECLEEFVENYGKRLEYFKIQMPSQNRCWSEVLAKLPNLKECHGFDDYFNFNEESVKTDR